MNENLNLVEILKDCPKGTKLYSPLYGDAEFVKIYDGWEYPIEVKLNDNTFGSFTKDGRIYIDYDGECMLCPSKDQRDWSKFEVKKPKFDPKTLQPFDRVLVRDSSSCYWNCDFFSRIDNNTSIYKYITAKTAYRFCIPYNDETKHLLGTTKEAPEYYRYWEE